MDPAEVLSRLGEAGRYGLLRLRLGALEERARRQRPRERRVPEIDGHLRRVDFQSQDRVLSIAAPWLNHRATLFNQPDFRLGPIIDWRRDYRTGVTAPLKYSPFINHRDSRITGDVKYIWELNRLQHLVPLLLAGVWTEREAYRQEVERQIESWREANPFMLGVNWKSPLEAGLRLISIATTAFVAGGSHGGPQLEEPLLQAIYLHQYFIRQFHSRHSSANNHLIGEMAGLYVASTIWPPADKGAYWRRYARECLIEQILNQTEPDGVNVERATEYHVFAAELFLIAGALGQRTADPFPPAFWNRLARMLGYLRALRDRSGNFPLFGDGDNGQALCLGDSAQERVRSLVQLLEPSRSDQPTCDLRQILTLWGQAPEQIPLASSLPPLWHGRPANSRMVETAIPLPGPSPDSYPSGGSFVLAADRGSEDEMVVVFDAGPFGMAPLYAHAHADALSFWLSYGGKEFLIDPGTYSYEWSKWRSYFRSTAAHNTIRVDRTEQAEQGGQFLWKNQVDARLESFEENDASVEVEGSHDGYRRLSDPVIHHRRLRLFKKSRTLAIIDRLECRGAHEVEIFYHFSEKCRLAQVKTNCFLVSNGDKSLLVQLDSRFEVRIEQGAESPVAGWVSRSFGLKEPCATLIGRATISGSAPFFSEIAPA